MIEFVFWNLVIVLLVAIVIKSKDFTTVAVSYLLLFWTLLEQVLTKPFSIQGRLMNITEYTNAANQTIREYAYETWQIPQNYLDFTYTVFLAVFSLYAAKKLLLTELGQKFARKVKGWWSSSYRR